MKFHHLFLFLLISFSLITCSDKDSENVSPNAPDGHYLQNVGASAVELLSDQTFKKLTIQIVYVAGFKPEGTAVNQLTAFLNNRINKPEGIFVQVSEVPAPERESYSTDDLREMENRYRTAFTQDEELSVFVFVADGNYSTDDNVLGVAYRNTSLALFGQKIHEVSGGIGQPKRSLLEATILNHEFGHILGLVNAGTPMQANHQDVAHGRHCIEETCLMYWSVETGDFVANLLGQTSPPSLDEHCQNDLRGNGGQ